jgi:hypothetical protein
MRALLVVISATLSLDATLVRAADSLPYTTRTRGYTGLSTTITGDLRTIGMAGSSTAVTDTVVSASQENPASLAMSLGGAGIQITSVETSDAQVQSAPASRGSFGLGASLYPWGFAMSQQTQNAEGQPYSVSGQTIDPDLRLREYRLSVARVFWDDRLALGTSIIIGESVQVLNESNDHGDWSVGLNLGATYQFPRRWFASISYTPGHAYEPTGFTSPELPGFFQPMKMPWRFNTAFGWVPNRFFKFSSSLHWIGPESGSALLKDETLLVGERITFQPRIGMSYRWIDMRAIRGRLNLGSYIETSRVAGGRTRMHVTGSIEVEPWIVNLGWGFDLAPDYRNIIFSGTVDLGMLAEILRVVPRPKRPPIGGLLPSPYFLSDEGLSRPMVANWVETTEDEEDMIEVGRDLPSKVRNRIENPNSSLKAIGKDFIETLETVPSDVDGDKQPLPAKKSQKKLPVPSPKVTQKKSQVVPAPTPSKKPKARTKAKAAKKP